jgi:tetratricopeptide (TPR) repeat protein
VEAYEAAYKDQNYKGATAGIQWMINNAPQWHTKLYVSAADTYDKLASQELDPSAKQNYVDSLMLIYDLRIKNCGEEENVLNRKAFSAYKYNGQNKAKIAEVLAIFDKTYEISGNNVLDNNLDSYMSVIKNSAEMLKSLSEDQIMQRYNNLMSIIEVKVKKAQEQNKANLVEGYKKVTEKIDTKFIKVAKDLCTKNVQDKNFDKATPLLSQIETKSSTPADKAWVNLLKGDIEFQKGNKPAARDLYKQALVVDPTGKDAYNKLGDLYSSSATDCTKTPGSAEEKLVYIAAYQQYFKAANVEKCQQTLTKYPTLAELQKANMKQGEVKKLTCWIDESVTVKAKKE